MDTETTIRSQLAEAQGGDVEAQRAVATWVYHRYVGRIARIHSQDPAIALEDLEMTFFEAIFKAVLLADGRGDDLYHIGQRGVWAVQSELKAIRRLVDRRAHNTRIVDGKRESIFDTLPDPSGDYREVVHSVMDADATVRVLANATLKPRSREALGLILSGLCDPTVDGFNKDLAKQMGVSPQRASQVVNDLRANLTEITDGQ